jgi:hypothetical protein
MRLVVPPNLPGQAKVHLAYRLQEHQFGGLNDTQLRRLRQIASALEANPKRRVVHRVVVHPDRIEVEVGKSELRAAIARDPRAASHQGSSDVVRLVLREAG